MVVLHFVFIVKLCMPGCPAALAGLCLQVRADPRATVFFHKDKTTTHLPHNMQQSMRYSYIQSRKPAVSGYSNGQH